MAQTFKAICKQTVHGFRGSQRIAEPSFIEGNVYEFTTKSFAVAYHGLGDFSVINERGIESIMSERDFDRRFRRVEE
jgi:hypothetical protein